MSTISYIEKTLQRDTEMIRRRVVEMGSMAEAALRNSLRALEAGDRQLAYSVIFRDQYINEAEKELDRLCLEFLVRQQPVAGHLRFVFATIKINYEMERIGDYAESIARQVLKLNPADLTSSVEKIRQLANRAIPMLTQSVQAFAARDAELAQKTMLIEAEVDELRDQFNTWIMEQKVPLQALTPLLTIARRFERVTDQAKHICEEVLYMCTGENIKHQGNEVFRILFIDEHNSGRSQIAEAVGNSLVLDKFVFSSAGLNPKQVDPRIWNYLQKHDYDLSRHHPKSLELVPLIEHYQVVVALTPAAKQAFLALPSKAVHVEWMGEDPVQSALSEDQFASLMQKVIAELQKQIMELVEAIRGKESKSITPKQ